MKVDYFSDPHCDFYIPFRGTQKEQEESIEDYFKSFFIDNREIGKVLIVAVI